MLGSSSQCKRLVSPREPVLGPVALLSSGCVPAWLMCSLLCRALLPEVTACPWPQAGSVFVLGTGTLPSAGAVHGPTQCLCVCECECRHASSCLLLPPEENSLQTEQGLGEGALKALTVGFPLLMFFLLLFCLLGILPVLYIYIYLCICYIFLPPCCCLYAVPFVVQSTGAGRCDL